MRFIHMSDLHLGKRLLERSFIDDQKYILNEIINVIKKENPDGVIIAGDIYDKSSPASAAIELFDDFLNELSELNTEIFIISGNHDSASIIGFGSSIFSKQHIHISPVFSGEIKPVIIDDTYIWLVPFIKPANVKSIYKDDDIKTYNDALKKVIDKMNINKNKVNILVAHQFVTNAKVAGSEELSLGGLDNIDAQVFEDFDYVALGHIHKKQTINKKIRYCGTPLKYSFDEVNNKNSITLVDVSKDKLDISEILLKPKRDLVVLKGKFDEIMSKDYISKLNLENYYQITLTDDEDIVDGARKLRAIYKNLLKIEYDNRRTNSTIVLNTINKIEEKTPIDLFNEFYASMNGKELNSEQINIMKDIIKDTRGNSK